MTTFFIDNKPYTAETEGRNLLEVCLSLGLDVPYFCWHPAFRSIGACRQCAVKVFKDANDTKGRIEMSCLIPVTEGMRVSIHDPEVVAFRRKIIEWLMVNHPHDCPICDEGGECHLQDMTVMTGHTYRNYRFTKRTYRNQALGPFVNMEMNRCIQCYRCVRFYRDYAGGRDFDVHGWHDHVYFGRHEDGILESEFSGNLVEVCPTGVFTDKSLKRHYTRKWDLQTAPSLCVHCGLGCNTIPGERYGTLRRIMPRFNGEVNGYFLCDRGRYGYEFVNGGRRLRRPLSRRGGELATISKDETLQRASEILKAGRAIGIGSPRASLESNFALRALVGPDRFYQGVSESELRLTRTLIRLLERSPARTPSLHEVQSCDSILILGEDVTNTAPMLDLAIRQAVLRKPAEEASKLGIYPWLDACLREAIQDDRGPLFIATPDRTKLDGQAAGVYRAAPDDIARLGFAVAHEMDPGAPAVQEASPELQALARKVSDGLKAGKRPLVLSGPGCGSEAVANAAANVAQALCRAGLDARLCFTAPECNSVGAAMLPGGSLDEAASALRHGLADTVVILENDLHRRLDPAAVEKLMLSAKHVIVLDYLANPTTDRAELVLPSATFAETSGTFVNNEGRAQRFFQVFVPPADTDAAWRWLGALMAASGKCGTHPWPNLDAVVKAMATEFPRLAQIASVVPLADFRVGGRKIPRQASRYSGRTAITAHLDVHEPKPPDDPDSPLAFSMEGFQGQPPAPLIPRFWAPQWNSGQAVNKFQIEVGGPLHGGDPGRRLIEPAPTAGEYAAAIPAAFVAQAGEWLILSAWHIYGSEELSVLSPGVAERTPAAYVALCPADAEKLGLVFLNGSGGKVFDPSRPTGIQEIRRTVGREWLSTRNLPAAGSQDVNVSGPSVRLSLSGVQLTLPVRINEALPPGVMLVPAGLPAFPALDLPAWGMIEVEGPR